MSSLKLKFNFKLSRVTPSERDTTVRDWKIIIAVFGILMLSAGWGFWVLFQTVSSKETPVGSGYQVANFNRESLRQAVEFYRSEAAQFDDVKAQDAVISDPSH
jgi:hypothetical protein